MPDGFYFSLHVLLIFSGNHVDVPSSDNRQAQDYEQMDKYIVSSYSSFGL